MKVRRPETLRCAWRAAFLLAAACSPGQLLFAQEKDAPPAIIAISPIQIVPGKTASLRIRGVKLGEASELKFPGAPVVLVAELKDKKKADLPNGLEAKDVGDTQLDAVFEVPNEMPIGVLALCLVTPGGTTAAREIRVVPAETLVEEKEPNGGFREAQTIELDRSVRATIAQDKDVDVFAFTAQPRATIVAEVVAARCASLLDPVLTLLDERGNVLGSNDDAVGRDARLAVPVAHGGKYFVVVQDAHDRGGAWHSYALTVHAQP